MAKVRLILYTVAGDFVKEIPFEAPSPSEAVVKAASFGYSISSAGAFSVYEARGEPLKIYWSHSLGRKIPTQEEIVKLAQKYG